MKTQLTATDIETAIDFLKSLDAADLARDYNKSQHASSCGSYCALVIDITGETTRFVNEASRSCSQESYFQTKGLISEFTACSGTRDHWTPGPQDGFEWEYAAPFDYIGNTNTGDYLSLEDSDDVQLKAEDVFNAMPEEKIAKLLGSSEFSEAVKLDDAGLHYELGDAAAFLQFAGWVKFHVGDTPVNGWDDENREEQISAVITERIEALEAMEVNE